VFAGSSIVIGVTPTDPWHNLSAPGGVLLRRHWRRHLKMSFVVEVQLGLAEGLYLRALAGEA
jgi:hypothetical protein